LPNALDRVVENDRTKLLAHWSTNFSSFRPSFFKEKHFSLLSQQRLGKSMLKVEDGKNMALLSPAVTMGARLE
jgi:hypothetical protein